MKGGRKFGLREKALRLVCSEDNMGQGCLQSFHTEKVGG